VNATCQGNLSVCHKFASPDLAYSVGTGDSFPRVKVTGTWSRPLDLYPAPSHEAVPPLRPYVLTCTRTSLLHMTCFKRHHSWIIHPVVLNLWLMIAQAQPHLVTTYVILQQWFLYTGIAEQHKGNWFPHNPAPLVSFPKGWHPQCLCFASRFVQCCVQVSQ
jgi:hypothetical protein